MDEMEQEEADRRLETALRERRLPDPREGCRALLRELRGRGEGEYAAAVADYRTSVAAAIAAGRADPIGAWLDFGVRLAERLHPGRTLVVDGSGRAREYTPPAGGDALILHLPAERGPRAIAVGLPERCTTAQEAAVDLLVYGKVKRRDEGSGARPTMEVEE